MLRHCRDTRSVKNARLEQLRPYDPRLGATPGPAERMQQLADARQALPWLAEGSSAAQQQAVRDFDRAASNFFAGTHGYPTWWKAGVHERFTVRDVKVRRFDRHNAAVLVPKCGWVRFRLARPLPAEHGMARSTLDRVGRWHVSFTAPRPGVNVRQKAGLNRVISEQGWGMRRRRIEKKAATCGVQVTAVAAAYTSQKCSGCGHTAPGNHERQAVFRCIACGHEQNADHNAALNILAAGTAVTARGGTAGSNGPREASISAVAA